MPFRKKRHGKHAHANTHTQTQIDDLLVYFPSIHNKQGFNVQKKKEIYSKKCNLTFQCLLNHEWALLRTKLKAVRVSEEQGLATFNQFVMTCPCRGASKSWKKER